MVGMKFLALRLNAVYARKYVHVRAGISFFQAEDCIRDHCVTGVQTCALPILGKLIVSERFGTSARKQENGFMCRRIVSSLPPRRNIRARNASNFNDRKFGRLQTQKSSFPA